MRSRLQIAAVIGFLVGGIGLVLALRPASAPELPEAPVIRRPAAQAPPTARPRPLPALQAPEPEDPPAPPPGTNPAGWAFRGDRPRPNSTAGEIEPLPPATPEIWRERRRAMAAAWREESLEAAARFGEAHLDPADQEHVLEVLEAMHDALEVVRAGLEAGHREPAEAREEMRAVRDDAARALAEQIGGAQTAALRAWMQDRVRGGSF